VSLEQNFSQHETGAAPARGWAERLRWRLTRRVPARDQLATRALSPEFAPGSRLMDACRTLRTNLAHATPGGTMASLLLAGAAPGPATALTAAGLALALAEEGQPVLLVDADMRAPLAHTLFGIDQSPGFAGLLHDIAGLRQPDPAVVAAQIERIWADGGDAALAPLVRDSLRVLPAGMSPPDPAALLHLPELPRFVQALAGHFAAVVYAIGGGWETPDALLLAQHVGAAVLVVPGGAVSAEDARNTRAALERVGAQVLGFAFVERM
jgi:Mrp family chromosome partitioning ATPase